ncbi:MAG: peptidoglycan-binding protein [Gammaproteobacteria bacterium]|nr:peptidoglycan-binding protein [Gammaproteobacteria bacterium]
MNKNIVKPILALSSVTLLTACQMTEKKWEQITENLASTTTAEVPGVADQSNWKVISYKEITQEPVREAATIMCPPLPQAVPGVCYAKISHDPIYNIKTISKLKESATTKLEVVPAEYETVEESVLVKEAHDELEVVPATYEWVDEEILEKPAYDRVEEVPAVYITETHKVLVSPSRSEWKVGTETNIQKVDHATGDVMCLIEIPAVYEDKESKRMVKEATTRKVHVPAAYKNVRSKVVKTAETTRVVRQVPAEYKVIEVRKLVKPETEKVVEVSAEYQDVEIKELEHEGRCEWRQILCSVNATPDRIKEIEMALKAAGQNPGMIDGVMDDDLFNASRSYQEHNGISLDPSTLDIINIDTVKALGISY